MTIKIQVDTAIVIPVNAVPLTDDTDFKTIETSIAYNAAGMDLVWNFLTTAGVLTQTAVTPTTAGVHDWTHAGDGIYKLEIPASGGTINNDTEGAGWFSGSITGVLPFVSPRYEFVPANVVNSLVNGIDYLQTDTTQWKGATAPANTGDAYAVVSSGTYGNSALKTLIDTVDTVVDAIKAVTDVLPNSGALSDLATLASRLSAARAGYLDKLNVTGNLAHSDDAATYKATGFSTHDAADVVAALGTVDANLTQIEGHALAGTGTQIADGFEYFFNVLSPAKTINDCGVAGAGLTAEDVWTYATRTLTAATNITNTGGTIYVDGSGYVRSYTSSGDAIGTTANQAVLISHMTDIKGTGFVKDTHSLPQCLTATGFSTHDAAAVIAAMGTGTFLTGIPWNSAWDAEVQSEVQDAIEVNHLDHLLAVDYDPASKPGVATALLNELIGNDAGVSQFTANALELAPSGGSGGDATLTNQSLIITHLTDIKGTGFAKDTNSLVNLSSGSVVEIQTEETLIQSQG